MHVFMPLHLAWCGTLPPMDQYGLSLVFASHDNYRGSLVPARARGHMLTSMLSVFWGRDGGISLLSWHACMFSCLLLHTAQSA